ncbi:MAG: hypothetical protein DMF06_03760 [Verrucomicrobia bacterium]|nr:MAG: hypothetical protein DMF06_03760 [Verrucomicrobiota bacterium]
MAAGAVSAIALTTAFAQTSTTTSTTKTDPVTNSSSTTTSTVTTDGSGTITSYTPGTDYISFRTETSSTPVKYYYTKSTTIVDSDGKTVEWSMLKPDMPVKYTYVKDGDRMVVSKITLQKPISTYEKTTTTTTTTKP